MKTSATILATIALGAMLATGSATASMARGGDGVGDGGGHDGGFGSGVHVGRFVSRMHVRGFRDNPGYYDPWLHYGTDAACSFDVVTARYVGPDGVWHYC